MAIRRWVLLLLSAAVISVCAGCGSNTTAVHNPPPPPGSIVAIAFQPQPPGSVAINATAAVTAVVSDDSSNAGVDWSLTCPNAGNCGSLSSLHTDSGNAVTYTPPAALSGNQQTVNVAAFATADHTKNVLAPITITAFGNNLKGTYVLQTSGVDASALPYQFAGVITLDGNGVITAGEQTYSNTVMSVSDPITGGSYFIGADGRGTLTLNTGDQDLGQLGVETFSLVFLSSSQALVAKIDDPNIQVSSNESSVGTLDLQTATTPPAGGYAFTVSGTDIATLSPTAFGGILNIDSPNTISGAGSIADQDLAGSVTNSAALSGTVSDPDSFGVVQFSLTTDFASGPIQFMGYIVDALHIKLIESDNGSGTGFGSTAGVAVGQGAATGTFTSDASFSGDYVFGILGEDLSGLPSSLASAGVFTADGKGHLTSGFNDEFLGGLFFQISDQFNGNYSVDSTGTGRVDSFINFRRNGPGPEFIFYLTGNGNPPLLLDADVNIGSLGAGVAYPATDPISLNGKYGLSFTQSVFGSENDATGQITVDGTAQTLSGTVDTNFFFTPVLDTPLTGSFASTSLPRRFTGTLSNELFPSDVAVAFYIIDAAHGFFVETDSQNSGFLSFGYFAARDSVCPECP